MPRILEKMSCCSPMPQALHMQDVNVAFVVENISSYTCIHIDENTTTALVFIKTGLRLTLRCAFVCMCVQDVSECTFCWSTLKHCLSLIYRSLQVIHCSLQEKPLWTGSKHNSSSWSLICILHTQLLVKEAKNSVIIHPNAISMAYCNSPSGAQERHLLW